MSVTKKPAARKAAPIKRRIDPSMRIRALELAILVSAVEPVPLTYGQQPLPINQWASGPTFRSRYDTPVNIVTTAETFLKFLAD